MNTLEWLKFKRAGPSRYLFVENMANLASTKRYEQQSEQPALLNKVELLARGGQLTLREWLQISWFYPGSFKKELIKETPSSYLVFSKDQILKFARPIHGEASDFKQRWFAACDEYTDHLELCDDLYLGLWLLKFVDGEPSWELRDSWKSINRHVTPEADEVALIMRRVSETRIASEQLRKRSEFSKEKLTAIATRVSKFHRRQKVEFSSEETSVKSHQLLSRVEQRVRSFAVEFGSYLDPYSQIALEQAASFVSSFVRNKAELLDQRLRDGLWIDGHGDLRSEKISCTTESSSQLDRAATLRISLFGRAPRNFLGRISDLLSDVASLVVDLESRGFREEARSFEEAYFLREGNSHNLEVYRFFLVIQSLLQGQRLMQLQSMESLQRATNCVSIAFRAALGIREKFFLGVIGQSSLADSVSEAIASLAGINVVQAGERTEATYLDSHFNSLLKQCCHEQKLSGGVVLKLASVSLEQQEQIRQMVLRHSYHYIVVTCDEKAALGASENIWESSRRHYHQPLAQYPIADAVSPPDLAFSILRQLCASH